MILVIFFSLFIPPLWLSWHLLRWKELALWKRGVGVLFLFLCSQIYPIDLWLFGSLSGPEMPRWLLLAQALALVALIISFLLVFCKDVLGWIFKKRSLKDKGEDGKERALVSDSLKDPKRRLFLQKGLSAFAFSCPLVGGLAGGYGVSQGIKDPIINRQKLKILDLPQGLAGFKIIQVTDLHIATLTTKTWIDNLVALINSQKPDIICITGDLADGIPSYSSPDGLTRFEVAQGLGKLKAPLGVFACTGNHEYYSDYKGWMEIFTRLGINFLHNRAEVLSYQGSKLVLAGRNDKQASYFLNDPTIPAFEIFKGKPKPSKRAFRVMLDHRPERAEEHAACGCQLQLSGHTHGGQCLGMDRLVAMANQGKVRGWYKVRDMNLYVSNGAGLWSGFPVRMGVPAEVALIELMAL